jgi:pSer/pThr/pTyr-binding forkhead associated (FHA) protein
VSGASITVRRGTTATTFTTEQEVTLGRDPSCDVQIESPHVSRAHAILRYDDDAGSWVLIDNGSTQGTYVDGRRTARTVLAATTVVTLGQPGRGEQVALEVAPAVLVDTDGTVPATLDRPGPSRRV